MSDESRSPGAPQLVVTAEAAQLAISAAISKAEELGARMHVAVYDSGGNLAGYLRMPGAFLVSGELAMAKARMVAGIGLPMAQIDDVLDGENPRVRRGLERADGFTAIHGGVPIIHDGQLLGGIGASGGSEAQDVACAEAGAAAIAAHYPERE